MTIHSIDSVLLDAADLDVACRPYERLGMRLSRAGGGRRTLRAGGPAGLFAIHFVAEASADGPLAEPLRRALAGNRSLFAVCLAVADLDAILGRLEGRGKAGTRFSEDGDDACWLPLNDQAGTDLVLVRKVPPDKERYEQAVNSGQLAHALPLRRLDHLAIVTRDLEQECCFWSDVLGVPVAGEVVTPTLVIRQLRIGDAVLELLGAASADSPLRQRPPGLVGMASWEVTDLEAVVAQVRRAGFTVSDPAVGPLPGTRIATVQGSELAGVNMQLLQYV
jgi:catechol 2,3-dioxygenase-like lactoylglutathione lyase family enzyme